MSSLFDTESDDSVEIVDLTSDDNNDNEQENNNSDDLTEKIAYFTKSLTAKHIQFSAVSVEYPPTDPKGYAIIYNFIKSDNYSTTNNDQIQKAMKNKARTVFHQYSQEGKGGASYVNCPFFEDPNNKQIQIIKDQRTCGGIKICSFAHDYFHNYTHTNVDFDSNIFQSIKNNEELRTAKKLPCPYIQENGSQCNGELKHGTSGHRYLPIGENIDRQLLKNLINGMPLNECEIDNT
ncbi:29300_t:CDS:2, partial [Racocetra persica]